MKRTADGKEKTETGKTLFLSLDPRFSTDSSDFLFKPEASRESSSVDQEGSDGFSKERSKSIKLTDNMSRQRR